MLSILKFILHRRTLHEPLVSCVKCSLAPISIIYLSYKMQVCTNNMNTLPCLGASNLRIRWIQHFAYVYPTPALKFMWHSWLFFGNFFACDLGMGVSDTISHIFHAFLFHLSLDCLNISCYSIYQLQSFISNDLSPFSMLNGGRYHWLMQRGGF